MMKVRGKQGAMVVGAVAAFALMLAACGDVGDAESEGAAGEPAEQSADESDEEPETADETEDPAGTLPPHTYEDGDVITLVLGTNPGGGFDIQANAMVEYLEPELQALTGLDIGVQVEYMPGGGHLVAMQHVDQAEPDGTTLLYVIAANAVAQNVVEGEDYDYSTQSHIAAITVAERGLVARASLEDEMSSWDMPGLKERSEESSILVGLTSALPQLQVMFGIMAEEGLDIDYDYVIYEGTSEIQVGLLRGEIDLDLASTTGFIPFVEDNPEDISYFVHGGCERLDVLPDVQSITETDAPGAGTICDVLLSEYRTINGPPGMDQANIDLLSLAIGNLNDDPAYVEYFEDLTGTPALFLDSEQTASHVDTLFSEWTANARFIE